MFQCPGCNADMRFDPESQLLCCDYCDTRISPDDYAKLHPLTAEEQEFFGDASYFTDSPQTSPAEDEYMVHLMTCPQCGGQLLTTEETAATFCSFCGSSVLLNSRITNEKKPDYIIPFTMSKEDCEAAYRKCISSAFFAPKRMKSEETVNRFRGIYMPYWVYSFDQHGPASFSGQTEKRHGDYIYKTHYRLSTHIDAEYEGISYDASSSFADNLSEAIAPFDFQKASPFQPAYLSGFYADTSDVPSSLYAEDARSIAASHATAYLRTDSRYASHGVDNSSLSAGIQLNDKAVKRGMFPVWFMSIKSPDEKRVSYAVVNGQTGKVACDIPVDFKKYLLVSLLIAIPLFFLFNFGFVITPGKILGITLVLSLIGLIMANRQCNLLYDREHNLDDKGFLSKYDPWSQGNQTAASQQTRSRNKTASNEKQAQNSAQAPAKGKNKTGILIKPFFGIVIALITLIISPTMDLFYYSVAVVDMIFVVLCFLDLIRLHNRLTTRKLPQFHKRGGEENENY